MTDVKQNVVKPKATTKAAKTKAEKAEVVNAEPQAAANATAEAEANAAAQAAAEAEANAAAQAAAEAEAKAAAEAEAKAAAEAEAKAAAQAAAEAEAKAALGHLQLRVKNHGKKSICMVTKKIIEEGEEVVITYPSEAGKKLAKGNFAQLNVLSGTTRLEVEG